jgi:hypothetical protein
MFIGRWGSVAALTLVVASSTAVDHDTDVSFTFMVVPTPEFIGPPRMTDAGFVSPFMEVIRIPKGATCLAQRNPGSYEALIESDGSVGSVHALHEPIAGDKCEKTALFPYIKKWRFRPATYNGKPTPVVPRLYLQ